jgi:hypothetical protein
MAARGAAIVLMGSASREIAARRLIVAARGTAHRLEVLVRWGIEEIVPAQAWQRLAGMGVYRAFPPGSHAAKPLKKFHCCAPEFVAAAD